MTRDELIVGNLQLPEAIARWVARRLPPSFDLDDLVATGNLALIRAADTYEPVSHNGTPFRIYARYVVRGAILDSVRRRHWESSTRPPLDDAPEAACAPTSAVTAERREQLRRVAAAASWLTLDQKTILAMHYGPREVSIEDIAVAMGHCTTWVVDRHRAAIAELRGRCRGARGAESIAVRRLFVVAPKTKIKPADDLDAKQRAEVDELGELEARLLPYRNDLKREEALRKSIRSRYDAHAPEKPFEAVGDRFVVIVSPRGNESVINYPKLIKSIGLKMFSEIARVTVKILEEKLDRAVFAEVVGRGRVGPRTLMVLKRDGAAPPEKRAA